MFGQQMNHDQPLLFLEKNIISKKLVVAISIAMSRVVIGNKPSTNISSVPMKETTKVFGFDKMYPDAKQALDKDAYLFSEVFL